MVSRGSLIPCFPTDKRGRSRCLCSDLPLNWFHALTQQRNNYVFCWTDSKADPVRNKARARSSKQAGGQEQRVRQQRGEKQDLLFFMGVSTAQSICWNHSPTKSRRNWTVVHVLGVEVFGETLCFLCIPPSPNTLLSNTNLFNSLFVSIEELAECQDLIFWVPAKRLWCFFCKGSWKLNVLYSVQNQWGWKYILRVGDILLHFLKFQIWYFHRPLRPDACVVTFLHMDTFL